MSIEPSPSGFAPTSKEATVACHDRLEITMSTRVIQRAASALAATALAATLATVAAEPVQAQSHSHDASASALSLDHGRKWATDAPLRDGMGRIRALVEPQLAAAHAGKLSQAQYTALAGQVETAVGGIVANCKLEPKADAVLHIVIAEIGAGTDVMAGKVAKQRPAQGLVQVAKAINDYGAHFDDPGLKPIPNIR
jgi:hypothetical protein